MAARYPLSSFLELRTTAASGFAGDGRRLLLASNIPGTVQLYRLDLPGGEPVQITSFPEPVAGRYLPNEPAVLIQMDEGGNERVQIGRIRDDGTGFQWIVREPEFIHRLGGISRDGRLIAYASNRRNGIDFDVYVRDLASGEEQMVFEAGGLCAPAGFSPDARYLAVIQLTPRNMDNELYLVDLRSRELIHVSPHEEEAQFGPPAWLPDGSSFFFATDCGREFVGVARYDLAARRREYVIETEWDASCSIDWEGRALVVARNEEGYTRLRRYDPRTLAELGEIPLPGRGVAAVELSRDGRLAALSYTSSSVPGDVWLYGVEEGTLRRLTRSPGEVPEPEFVEPELHRFCSFDGESIPAFVYRPRGVSGPPPVIVYIHGGPEAQFVPSFNPLIQYFVHRGYAVVAPNVRGSTGYGKRYHHLDDVEKRLDAVRDLEALHDWLPSVGLDPRRAALMGGSYGGFMVLAGLAFQPERWAAGVDVVGIASFVTFLENTAPWRRAFREREYGSLEHHRGFLERISPLTHADRIRAPLFIIHGTNDPRVPVDEAKQIYEAVRRRGVPAELLIYEDEGHGLQKLKNRLDAYPKVADFLDRVLGGAGA